MSATATILIIDDDATLLELLSGHLESAGYRTVIAEGGEEGLREFQKRPPDLVILDVMMPGMDGWEVCRRLRAHSSVAIVMLTAKGEEMDKLRSFRLGVDDYVTKPFSFAELTARVGAVLSRSARSPAAQRAVESGDLAIDLERQQVCVRGEVVDLTPTEYRLLETLARNAPRTLSVERLVEEVWGDRYVGETDHVKHYVWSLRRKIEDDPGDPTHLLTRRGLGYRFE